MIDTQKSHTLNITLRQFGFKQRGKKADLKICSIHGEADILNR